jgi:hypothetical protein
MAIEYSLVDQALAETEDSRRASARVPALNMEEVELTDSSGQSASAWLGDESDGGMGVLILGSAVETVDWLQPGVQVAVRHGRRKRQATVRRCTLDSPTVMFVGLEWLHPKRRAARTKD